MKILILTPLGNSTHHMFTHSLAETYRQLPHVSWFHTPAVSDVAGARNHLLSVFMQSTSDIAVWIDSDEDWQPKDIEMVTLPIRRGETELCAAPYAQKKPGPVKWNFALWPSDVESQLGYIGPKLTIDKFRYARCKFAGAGFLAMSRAAVLKSASAVESYAPFLNLKRAGIIGDGFTLSTEKHLDLFEPRIVEGNRFGEDYGACHIFNKVGLDILLSLDTNVGHYDGNLRYGEELNLDEYARRCAK